MTFYFNANSSRTLLLKYIVLRHIAPAILCFFRHSCSKYFVQLLANMYTFKLRSVVLDLTSRMKTKISSINKRTINKDTNVYISSFIPEVLEIIRLAQPILSADLIQLYKDIKGIDTFTFIKRNGEAFSREIQVTYIWKMLEVAQIVRIDEGYLSLLNYSKTQNFMLRYSGNAMDRERNRIICRKYRYGEKV